ncbi:MAG TPA: Asp-tRNA(Asn)/Glu-tRNA(Gln) amidotransferase subunit GatA [candidate division Zixibacteria bacterium]|nr:Asp-tRNA(Asn)/Glu-tRNA(Gln) amidotransferase subunit GatA [candidate division Zixibacteria bacterium]
MTDTAAPTLPLADRTIGEVADALRRRELTSRELTEACLARIERDGARLNTFLAVQAERALAAADEADAALAAGEGSVRPLLGIPYALKDIFVTRALDDSGRPSGGLPTTAGSKILEGYLSPYASDAEERLALAGAVLLGKTNCDEFAMGSSNENSAFGPVRNPWDETTVPGGSSGGSAAAVAAGQAFFALGTDTGGSIRQPASLSGIVGMKPTYGRVSRYGMVAFASSLDQCGPFARSVRDVALVLAALAGHDPRDSTSVDVPVPDYLAALTGDVRGLRLGVPSEFFVAGMEPGVEAAVRAAFDVLRDLGAELVDVSLPSTDAGLATYYIIAPAEASANLARYDGIKYGFSAGEDDLLANYLRTRGSGFGPEVKRRIMLGTYALSAGYYDAYYVKAQQVRTLIKAEFDRVLADVDALLAPTSPSVAFKIGAKVDDPLLMYLNDACTLPVNIAGLPGISVPCGLSEGLPVGLQVIGRAFDEATVLRVADAYERAAGFSALRPPTAHD